MTFTRAPARSRWMRWLCALACCLGLAAAWASPAAADGPTLRVALDDNYPPYIFRDASGALTGYLVDDWRLWESKTGVHVQLLASDWAQAQARMQAGEADVIDTIFETPQRDRVLDFSPEYAQIPVDIYVSADIGGIAALRDLKGFLVGVKAGDACIDTLTQAGVMTLKPYANYETLIQAAIGGQVRMFCLDEPPASYLLYRDGASKAYNKAFQLGAGAFHRAVHKGDGPTLSLVNKGFEAITPGEERSLHAKWMGTRLFDLANSRSLVLGLLGAVLLVLLAMVWVLMLRQRVAQRTAELDAERARLGALLEALPDQVWMKDLDGVYRFCNANFVARFGVEQAHVIGCTDDAFFDATRVEEVRAQDRWVVESDSIFRCEEWVSFAPDGRRALMEITKTPTRNASGSVVGVLGLARDVTARRESEHALQESENRLHTILDNLDAHIYIKDADYRYRYANKSLCGFHGKTLEDIIGSEDSAFFSAGFSNSLRSNDWRVIEHGERVAAEEVLPSGLTGQERIFYSVKVPLRDKNGQVYALCGISTDITERKTVESSLRVAATAFEAQEGMMITDAQTVILRVNQSLVDMTGYSTEQLVGQTPRLLSSGQHDADFYAAMWDCVHQTGGWKGEIWDRHRDGHLYPVWMTISTVRASDGTVTNYVATHIDITERKQAEEQIRNLAFFDPLTHLPNRRLLIDRLQQALAASARSHREGALLFIDMDHFKTLNDTRGHDCGDLLLQEVAARLRANVREGDSVARLGGDEFVVMLEDLSDNALAAATQAEAVAEKILVALGQTYVLDGQDYRCTASVGVTLLDVSHCSVEDLMKRADLAMYQAKAAGRNQLRFFDPRMQAEVFARAALDSDLRNALREQQFVLHFQPQVNAFGDVTGVESLVRWQHPERGLVPPGDFIALAEETGAILPLGNWVLHSACAQIRRWATDPRRAQLSVAVNVSARQLHQEDFVQQVLQALAGDAHCAQRLKLELTESMLVSHIDATIFKMLTLKNHGVRFSLDDFGTGYSSLAYLKRLPLDELKIDQGFVRDILDDSNDATIASTIIALADKFGLGVIAEGVESPAHQSCLSDLGCSAFQGYLYSRPLPVEALEHYLDTLGASRFDGFDSSH